jgi:hypothetical protein
MRRKLQWVTVLAVGITLGMFAKGDVMYNNLTPNNLIAVASRPGTIGAFEIEAADDFLLGSPAIINSASLVGLLVSPTGAPLSVSDVTIEIYRVFPNDSNVGRTSGAPLFSTSQVPTRVNSPSDVAFDDRDSATAGQLTFSTSVLSATFTALNSVQPGGIHPSPLQTTGGNGALTGQEVQFNITFTTPFNLPADHYFFVPQITLANGAQFYWLSASRPITGAGTTPFAPDLQAWTRDVNLDPDWLRVGTDIVGGATPPTFNAAFSLNGTSVPEPSSIALVMGGLALIGFRSYRASSVRRAHFEAGVRRFSSRR